MNLVELNWTFGVSGKTAYSIIWGMQYTNLFLVNVGFLILGGHALKVTIYLLLLHQTTQPTTPSTISKKRD